MGENKRNSKRWKKFVTIGTGITPAAQTPGGGLRPSRAMTARVRETIASRADKPIQMNPVMNRTDIAA
ncbi:hypothetical protein [Chelatococcus asaccharovorans]|uniref:hypothetical protein n=1 Tax=Chelatococcus asaccharovorans TaxID=28210 RepID=UPI0011B65379|nr:hypothetical protein [Chelatococcus asaccharovorans]MBS7703385.1 hypothetical protein [Chelatococcus asaccharovorans]